MDRLLTSESCEHLMTNVISTFPLIPLRKVEQNLNDVMEIRQSKDYVIVGFHYETFGESSPSRTQKHLHRFNLNTKPIKCMCICTTSRINLLFITNSLKISGQCQSNMAITL